MDLGIFAALIMLVIWAIGALRFDAPGWIHALLMGGVFLLIYRIVRRGTPPPPSGDERRSP